MLIVLAYCDKDALSTINLLNWIRELEGEAIDHHLLLMAATSMVQHTISRVNAAARYAFKTVTSVKPTVGDESGWPGACNHLFRTSAFYIVQTMPQHFWWIEPDCVLLKNGGFSALEAEYKRANKPFMGCIYERPFKHLTGCAMYPRDIERYNPFILRPYGAGIGNNVAWDCIYPGMTLQWTHHTQLFQHEWGNFEKNIAPSFPDKESLSLVRPDAVLFHRNKDGSLANRLRELKRPSAIARFNENLFVLRKYLRLQRRPGNPEMA